MKTTSNGPATLKALIGDYSEAKTVQYDKVQREALIECYKLARRQGNLILEEGKPIGFHWFLGSRGQGDWVDITFSGDGEFTVSPGEDQWEVKERMVQAILHKKRQALSDLMDVDPWRNVVVWDYPDKKTKKGAKA